MEQVGAGSICFPKRGSTHAVERDLPHTSQVCRSRSATWMECFASCSISLLCRTNFRLHSEHEKSSFLWSILRCLSIALNTKKDLVQPSSVHVKRGATVYQQREASGMRAGSAEDIRISTLNCTSCVITSHFPCRRREKCARRLVLTRMTTFLVTSKLLWIAIRLITAFFWTWIRFETRMNRFMCTEKVTFRECLSAQITRKCTILFMKFLMP